MSDEKRYTEREKVEAERSAFADAVSWCRGATDLWSDSWITRRDHLYPLPKVTRPRVVKDAVNDREFRVYNGQMQTRSSDAFNNEWRCLEQSGVGITAYGGGVIVNARRVAMWADLLANPTEEVDAE